MPSNDPTPREERPVTAPESEEVAAFLEDICNTTSCYCVGLDDQGAVCLVCRTDALLRTVRAESRRRALEEAAEVAVRDGHFFNHEGDGVRAMGCFHVADTLRALSARGEGEK